MIKDLPDKYKDQLPIFFQPWWLNIVCKDGMWQYIVSEHGKELGALFPIYYKQKWGIKYISMPHYTPYLGPYFFGGRAVKEATRLSFEEKMIEQFIENTRNFTVAEFNLRPQISNVYPFLKNGYRNNIKYTYRIGSKFGVEGYSKHINSKLHKEILRNKFEIEDATESKQFFEYLASHHKKKKIDDANNIGLLKDLDVNLMKRGRRRLFVARERETFAGGVYLIEDKDINYLLFTVKNDECSANGVMAKIIDHAIKYTLKQNKDFDFEGSMIPGVERFFRKFGGKLTPYLVLKKESNVLLRMLKELRSY